MRCVLYLRVSTDEQATSIADQRRSLNEYAKSKKYTIVGEFVDEGISGDATEKRRAFQSMMKECTKKKWELILCWDQDRFGRFDAVEAGYWIKPMRDAGIALETIGQGRIDWNDFASRIVWSINQEAKHGFLRDLARSSLRGSLERARSGAANGRNPYGYIKGEDGHYIFDDAEKVAAVRRIFDLRLLGFGVRIISANMNRAGIKSPSGGKCPTIQSASCWNGPKSMQEPCSMVGDIEASMRRRAAGRLEIVPAMVARIPIRFESTTHIHRSSRLKSARKRWPCVV